MSWCLSWVLMTVGRGGPPSPQMWLRRWQQLVGEGKIMSTAALPDGRKLRYGVVLDEQGECEEYCEGQVASALQRVATIDGTYDVILRATRAFRPPAAPRLGDIPPHDETTCSFCSGPLRLELREKIAQAELPSGRGWDVHYNIAPMEPGGHFLLVPDISLASSRREQRLLPTDAIDLSFINKACSGILCVNFNAANAGASQNHIHAHAWVIDSPYPIMRAAPLSGSARQLLQGAVSACIIDWPASVIRLRGSSPESIGMVIGALCEAAPVHNVVFIGGDAFFFARSASGETSSAVPDLKVGSIQLLGRYVVDSTAQFDAASTLGAVDTSLRATRFGDGSYEEISDLLARVAENLL